MSKHDLGEMGREAKVHLSPYPVLDIGFIRVYRLNDKFVRYETYEDILLVGPKGGMSLKPSNIKGFRLFFCGLG